MFQIAPGIFYTHRKVPAVFCTPLMIKCQLTFYHSPAEKKEIPVPGSSSSTQQSNTRESPLLKTGTLKMSGNETITNGYQ